MWAGKQQNNMLTACLNFIGLAWCDVAWPILLDKGFPLYASSQQCCWTMPYNVYCLSKRRRSPGDRCRIELTFRRSSEYRHERGECFKSYIHQIVCSNWLLFWRLRNARVILWHTCSLSCCVFLCIIGSHRTIQLTRINPDSPRLSLEAGLVDWYSQTLTLGYFCDL